MRISDEELGKRVRKYISEIYIEAELSNAQILMIVARNKVETTKEVRNSIDRVPLVPINPSRYFLLSSENF